MGSFITEPLLRPVKSTGNVATTTPTLAESHTMCESKCVCKDAAGPSFTDVSITFAISALSNDECLLSFVVSAFAGSPRPDSLTVHTVQATSFTSLTPRIFKDGIALSKVGSEVFSFFFILIQHATGMVVYTPTFSATTLVDSVRCFPSPGVGHRRGSFPPGMGISFFVFSSFFLMFSLMFFFGWDIHLTTRFHTQTMYSAWASAPQTTRPHKTFLGREGRFPVV